MKIKLFAVSALLFISSLASAQSMSVGYAQKALTGGGQTHLTSLGVKNKLSDQITGDLALSADINDATNTIVNRYELGATYSQPLSNVFTGDVRVGHGWKAKSGSEATQYYVFETALNTKIPNTPVSVRVGYRWRDAYDKHVADSSTTTRLAMSYEITNKDKVSLGRDWLRGDGANIQTTIQYSRAF